MAPARAQQNGIELEVRCDTQVADFELKYPPGSYPGWHKHPGNVIAKVKSGRCVALNRLYCNESLQGRAFTEVAPHYVSNVVPDPTAKNATAVLEITQL